MFLERIQYKRQKLVTHMMQITNKSGTNRLVYADVYIVYA